MKMDKAYCVKFIRCDGAVPPVEEYYYFNEEDARAQFDFFKTEKDPDFPKMYDRIQLLHLYGHNFSAVSEEIRYHG